MPTTTSQSASYLATGTLDRDITDIITNITPDKTPFLSMLHVGDAATEMSIEWHTDDLRPAQKNMRPELDEYTNIKMAGGVTTDKNWVQIFREDGMVSDVMNMINKTYNPKKDEIGRQKLIKMKELAKDMEYAIMVNTTSRQESGNDPAMMGGVPYFMTEKTINVTINTDSAVSGANTIVAASAHGLVTGNFVVFKEVSGDSLPPEIEVNQRYYIRQDATTPATVFTLYNELEDAVEGKNQIEFTDPGASDTDISAKIMLNNVISAENKLFTEQHISDAMELAYMRGGDPTNAVMSPANKRRFTEILNKVNTTNRNQSDKRVEEVVSVYESDFGTVTAMGHRDCTNNNIYLLDMNYWALRYLDRPHIISEDKLGKSGSYEKFIVTAAMSLEGTQPLASACISNIKRPPKTSA